MNRATADRITTALQKCAAAFPGAKIGEATLAVYLEDLSDLEVARVEAACATSRRTSRFFPTVAELRELAGGDPGTAACAAWQLVLREIHACGAYRAPVFEDPRIPCVINRLGGWIHICTSPSEELHKWTHKAFVAEFMTVANAGIPIEADLRLAGVHEESALAGFAPVKLLPGGAP